jgi:hypothetical protein
LRELRDKHKEKTCKNQNKEIDSVTKYIQNCTRNGKKHVRGTEDVIIAKQIIAYRSGNITLYKWKRGEIWKKIRIHETKGGEK